MRTLILLTSVLFLVAYNAEVDAASWAEMLGLFDKTLK
jgi:hypothetical protein